MTCRPEVTCINDWLDAMNVGFLQHFGMPWIELLEVEPSTIEQRQRMNTFTWAHLSIEAERGSCLGIGLFPCLFGHKGLAHLSLCALLLLCRQILRCNEFIIRPCTDQKHTRPWRQVPISISYMPSQSQSELDLAGQLLWLSTQLLSPTVMQLDLFWHARIASMSVAVWLRQPSVSSAPFNLRLILQAV